MRANTDPDMSNYSSVFEGIITPTFLDDSHLSTLPYKEGWLEKKSTGLVSRWIKRFFILESQELKYFYSDTKAKFGGVINFNIVTIEVQINKNIFKLVALGGKRAFKLRCKSEQDALDWVFAITMHINSSNGRKIVLPISGKSNFWKFNRISESDFKNMACTGDLLLFRGKDLVSKIQRIITKSEYDHVDFILKYSSGKIGLFEATGVEGVSIVFWDDFRFYQWEKLYTRLVYRRLEFDRSEDALERLEKFIRTVNGKKYRISASKLMSNKIDKEPGTKEAFFVVN